MPFAVDDDDTVRRVDSVHLHAPHEFDLAVGEPRQRVQGHIVGVAPQKILAEQRAFVRNRGVCADETHRQSDVVLAERFGGAQAGRSAADDDEPWFGHRGRIPEGPQV